MSAMAAGRPSEEERKAPTVLVIEDEVGLLEIVALNLRASGYQVLTASDGLEGWRLFEEGAPDLVILDLQLPTISGFRLLELFKGPSGRPEVPVLALTALDFAEAEDLADLGLEGFITKPFEPGELLAAVRDLLQRREKGEA
ncbi:MAG: response regulator [Anaerolineae bacterium]